MINLTNDEQEKRTFIIDLEVLPEGFRVTYADNREELDRIATPHNLEVYRNRMIEQFKKNKEGYLKRNDMQVLLCSLIKWGVYIGGLFFLYFTYNIDIHILIKILLTLGVLLVEGINFVFSHLYLLMKAYELDEVAATEFYIDHLTSFENAEEEDIHRILNIEEIAKHKLTKKQLEQVLEEIESIKREDEDAYDFSLTFKKKEEVHD